MIVETKAKVIHGFTIQKDIEVPNKRGKWSDICDRMEINDSVLVPTNSARQGLIARINNRFGYKGVSRKEGDKFRVWKKTDKIYGDQ
jgi:hypothetical protein